MVVGGRLLDQRKPKSSYKKAMHSAWVEGRREGERREERGRQKREEREREGKKVDFLFQQSHTSQGLPAAVSQADRMTCVIYQTRGARPQEKNRLRVTKPPESSPPLTTRGVCHGIDTDKSTEIEHTWIHSDTNTQAEETHTVHNIQTQHVRSKLHCGFERSLFAFV